VKPPFWQETMIMLARSRQVRGFMQGNPVTTRLARQFVGGANAEAAIQTALDLKRRNLRASLYYLGEYVDRPELVEENVQQKIAIARRLGENGLDVHVSVDPTQFGYSISDELGETNALRIGQVIAEQPKVGVNLLMFDMEDYACCQKTLDLHTRLKQAGIPVAIAIQAYLYRSEEDIRQLVRQGAAVRLVKGAFAEPKDRALHRKKDIDRNYIRLAELLLSPEARATGVYPIFGTHDDHIIHAIRPLAARNSWNAAEYEFEMLFGVRPAYQEQLVSEGHRVRLYLPFGTEWWPYSVRRIGENAANIKFLVEAIVRRN
jgi:proline dehydrogenase